VVTEWDNSHCFLWRIFKFNRKLIERMRDILCILFFDKEEYELKPTENGKGCILIDKNGNIGEPGDRFYGIRDGPFIKIVERYPREGCED